MMQPSEEISNLSKHNIDTFRVLIVDDDEHFRNSYTRALNLIRSTKIEAVIHATAAENGNAALSTLENNCFDCCIIDYKLPDMNGLILQRKILTRFPDMAVIIVTGHGCEEVASASIKEGAMDYIVKGSISIEQIESAIVHAIHRVRLSKALELQRKQLMKAERQRIMMQSLGTACHHIAQPLTVLRSYLVMLKRKEKDPEQSRMLVEAFKACETLCDVVWKISHTSAYHTEPYLEADKEHPDDGTGDLITLNNKGEGE